MPHLRSTLRSGVLVVLAELLVAGGPSGPADAVRVVPFVSFEPTMTVTGTPEQEARVADVVGQLTDLGLPLPDLHVDFAATTDPCDGHMGLFRVRDYGWSVTICSDYPFVLPHELAHAWERATWSDADRAEYVAARDLEAWQHPNRALSGREDAAFVVQLMILGDGEPRDAAHAEAFAMLRDLGDARG